MTLRRKLIVTDEAGDVTRLPAKKKNNKPQCRFGRSSSDMKLRDGDERVTADRLRKRKSMFNSLRFGLLRSAGRQFLLHIQAAVREEVDTDSFLLKTRRNRPIAKAAGQCAERSAAHNG